MRVKMIFEGQECSLVIEPETKQDKAMLAQFGIAQHELEATAQSTYERARGFTDTIDVVRVVVRRKPTSPTSTPID